MGFLTANDRQDWAAAFNDAFSKAGDLDRVVRFAQAMSLEQLAGTGPLTDVVVRLIARADDEGWAPNLARTAFAVNPRDRLQRIVRQIEIREQLDDPNPFLATRMVGQPMLDRENLRSALQQLERDTGSRVFVIEGTRLSGKSYTIQFLRFIADQLKSFGLVQVDLERQFRIAGGPIRADQLAKAVVNGLGLGAAAGGMPVFSEEQEARYVLEFGEWLGTVLPGLGRRQCVVIDHFSKALLSQGSGDLVIELCRQAFTAPNLVVVLLEYDRVGDLQSSLGRIVDHSVIQVIDPVILRRDLTRYFAAMVAERRLLAGVQPGDEVVAVAATATQNVLGRVHDGEQRMIELRDAVAAELQRLVAPAPGEAVPAGGGAAGGGTP